jgi:hypothetical protein
MCALCGKPKVVNGINLQQKDATSSYLMSRFKQLSATGCILQVDVALEPRKIELRNRGRSALYTLPHG